MLAQERAGGFAFHASPLASNYRRWLTLALLAVTDAASIALTEWLFRSGREVPKVIFFPSTPLQNTPLDTFAILGAIFITIRYVSGDYSKRQLFWDNARATTITLLVLSMPCFLILLALPGRYSAVAEITSWTFLLFVIPVFRQGMRVLLSRLGVWRLPTALIASGSRAEAIFQALSATLSLGYDLRWLALDDSGSDAPVPIHGVKRLLLTDAAQIARTLAREGCGRAVVATDDTQSPAFADLVQRLMEVGISVSFSPSFRRLPLVGATTSCFFGRDILLFQVQNSLQRLPQRLAKRGFDILAGLVLMAVSAPAFAAIAAAIKLHDGGPILYRQRRVGRNGEHFTCLKFRTMAVDADDKLERWKRDNPELYEEFLKTYKLVNDPRVTGPGRWLRKTSLDELPQLLNVLLGDMSLVGPRPVLERELIEFYGPAAQLYKRVRPGMTGLWQVNGRSMTTYSERVVYDEWYILNWSFWYDIVILLQTAWIVVSGRGAC